MAKVNANTVLADPETGQPVVLLAGEDVPGWAKDLVGDHLTKKVADDSDGGTDGGSQTPPADEFDLATANVDEVLAYVGDDRAKAREALAAEEERETPRVGVTEPLDAMLATWHPSDHSGKDVLDYVGDDAARAADVLELERVGDNRKTVVSALEKLTAE